MLYFKVMDRSFLVKLNMQADYFLFRSYFLLRMGMMLWIKI